jgi:hypothetical protein
MTNTEFNTLEDFLEYVKAAENVEDDFASTININNLSKDYQIKVLNYINKNAEQIKSDLETENASGTEVANNLLNKLEIAPKTDLNGGYIQAGTEENIAK